MSPIKNGRLIFNQVPEGYPIPGQTTVFDSSATIDLGNVDLKGGILVKTQIFSIDPSIRNRMNSRYVVGEPVFNFGLGVVVRSDNPHYAAGDHVEGLLNFEEYTIVTDISAQFIRKVENAENLPWSLYVGALGMPGKTAYYGWEEFAKPSLKKGDVLFISTGAGPVGSLVIQLAKLDGLKVIASAGSDGKVEFMKSIGADVAFNYKTTETSEVLEKEGPINFYWDHVGGDTLDAALAAAAPGATIILCGMISGYNDGYQKPIRNLMMAIYKTLKLFGLFVLALDHKYSQEFDDKFPKLFKSGQLKYIEDITHGLESAGNAILAQQKGENVGKSIVIVAEE